MNYLNDEKVVPNNLKVLPESKQRQRLDEAETSEQNNNLPLLTDSTITEVTIGKIPFHPRGTNSKD